VVITGKSGLGSVPWLHNVRSQKSPSGTPVQIALALKLFCSGSMSGLPGRIKSPVDGIGIHVLDRGKCLSTGKQLVLLCASAFCLERALLQLVLLLLHIMHMLHCFLLLALFLDLLAALVPHCASFLQLDIVPLIIIACYFSRSMRRRDWEEMVLC
jgi:hypothetical protein